MENKKICNYCHKPFNINDIKYYFNTNYYHYDCLLEFIKLLGKNGIKIKEYSQYCD